MDKNGKEYSMELDIGDCRVVISMLGGFFDLRGARSARSTVHSHTGFEIHAVIDGEGRLETEGGSYSASGGEILLVPPGLVHRAFYATDGIKTSLSFFLTRRNNKAKNGLYDRISRVLGGVSGITKISRGEKYVDYLERIFNEYYSEKIYAKERLKALYTLFITDLLYDLGESSTEGLDSAEERRGGSASVLQAVMEEYVTVNFNKTPSLGELARAVHLGERQTARVFREYFKEGFSEYVSRSRIDMAKYFLTHTDKSLGDIATEVGYLSYNGFFKLFKNKTGLSPEGYRERYKENL